MTSRQLFLMPLNRFTYDGAISDFQPRPAALPAQFFKFSYKAKCKIFNMRVLVELSGELNQIINTSLVANGHIIDMKQN
jgi:hypothetical protein